MVPVCTTNCFLGARKLGIQCFLVKSSSPSGGGYFITSNRGGPCQCLGSEILHKSIFGVCELQHGQKFNI